jgi:hypothetical protein
MLGGMLAESEAWRMLASGSSLLPDGVGKVGSVIITSL